MWSASFSRSSSEASVADSRTSPATAASDEARRRPPWAGTAETTCCLSHPARKVPRRQSAIHSRYQKGASTPDGQTQFRFRAAGLNFHSTAYEWLVISGARARYKGSGTVNGVEGYGFLLTATDGDVFGGGGTDRFRLKIWDRTTSAKISDNQLGDDDTAEPNTALGGGSITIPRP